MATKNNTKTINWNWTNIGKVLDSIMIGDRSVITTLIATTIENDVIVSLDENERYDITVALLLTLLDDALKQEEYEIMTKIKLAYACEKDFRKRLIKKTYLKKEIENEMDIMDAMDDYFYAKENEIINNNTKKK